MDGPTAQRPLTLRVSAGIAVSVTTFVGSVKHFLRHPSGRALPSAPPAGHPSPRPPRRPAERGATVAGAGQAPQDGGGPSGVLWGDGLGTGSGGQLEGSGRAKDSGTFLMHFDALTRPAVEAFVHAHQAWAAPIAFALAFGESLAFISLLLPAWGALIALGIMSGAGDLNFWPIWLAGSIGAALGDWLSYWIGLKLEHSVYHMWPLSRHPDLIPQGEGFVQKWGASAIFIGRFFGPLRASVPLVAGIFAMPFWRFQCANWTSAFVWAAGLLTLGDVISKAIQWLWG